MPPGGMQMRGGVVGPISAATFLRSISMTISMTFIPVYAVSFHVGPSEMAMISAIGVAAGVALLPFLGYFSDYFGRELMMTLSCLMISLVPLPTLLMRNFGGVTLSWILFNLGMMGWMTSRGAKIASSVKKRTLGLSFAFVALMMQIGRTITPYLAGLSISSVGYVYTFLASTYIGIASSLVIVTMVKPSEKRRREKFSLSEFVKAIKPERGEMGFQTFLILDRAAWRFWIPLMNSYFRAFLGLSPEEIGLLGTIRGGASAITMLGAGRLVDKVGWFPMLLTSEITGIFASLALGLGRSFYVLSFAMVMIAFSVSGWAPAFNVAVVEMCRKEEELGRAYSKANFYRTAASIPSSFLGGLAYSLSHSLPFLMGSLLMAANCMILLKVRRGIVRKEGKRENEN